MPRRSRIDAITEASEPSSQTGRRGDRLRLALVAVLVLLFILLITIVVFVSGLLAPTGTPTTAVGGRGLTWVRSIYGWGSGAEDQFEYPSHTAIGPDGTIWVTDYTKSRVLGFAPDGSFRRELTASTSESGDAMLSLPLGVAASENGDVFVASSGTDTVIVWSANGEIARVIPVPGPIQLAVREDRLFVTSVTGLYLFTTEGEQVSKWSARGTALEHVDLPTGAVIGPDGTLYISDTHNVQIKAWSADGASVLWANPETSRRAGLVTPGGTDDEAPTVSPGESHPSTAPAEPSEDANDAETSENLAASMQIPTGLTMDAAGRLVFVDPFSFSIYTADAETGEITGRYGDQGAADGRFNYPLGIAYDAERDWFAVTDTANARVQIVRIDGSGGSAVAALRRVDGPWGVCAAPFVLLVIALVVAVARRRRRRAAADPVTDVGSLDQLALKSDVDSDDSL